MLRRFRARLPKDIPPSAWVIIASMLLWHAPSIALDHARILAARLRFVAVMAAVDVLFALRRDRAARNLLAATIRHTRRAERAAERAIRERRR